MKNEYFWDNADVRNLKSNQLLAQKLVSIFSLSLSLLPPASFHSIGNCTKKGPLSFRSNIKKKVWKILARHRLMHTIDFFLFALLFTFVNQRKIDLCSFLVDCSPGCVHCCLLWSSGCARWTSWQKCTRRWWKKSLNIPERLCRLSFVTIYLSSPPFFPIPRKKRKKQMQWSHCPLPSSSLFKLPFPYRRHEWVVSRDGVCRSLSGVVWQSKRVETLYVIERPMGWFAYKRIKWNLETCFRPMRSRA